MGSSKVMPGGWPKTFGGRLQHAIWQQGWPSAREFGKACDADAGTSLTNHIRKIVGGWTVPTAYTLAVMARRLPDVNVRWLLTGQPKGDPAMRPERGEEEC